MTILQMIQAIEDAGKLEEFDRLVTAGRIMVTVRSEAPVVEFPDGYDQYEVMYLGDMVMPEGWRSPLVAPPEDLPF